MSKQQHDLHDNSRIGAPLLPVLVALLAALAFILTHVDAVDRHLVAISSAFDPLKNSDTSAPLLMRAYATDSYMWLQHASDASGFDDLRFHYTEFDNHPQGRPVHWNSAYTWYLKFLGSLRQLITPSEAPAVSTARMAIWSNAIILAGFLVLIAWPGRRLLGNPAAIALILATVCLPAYYESFLPAYPDHHGLIVIFLTIGLAAFLVAVRGGSLAAKRTSAIAFALCFWVSAISTALLLGAFGIGLLMSCWLAGKWQISTKLTIDTQLLRSWGRWGLCFSMALYLLEYLPALPLTTLEINHPLYALAWWGGAELLAIFCPALLAGKLIPSSQQWLRVGLAILAICLLPVLLFSGGGSWHAYADPFLREVYNAVIELQPLGARLAAGTLSWSGLISVSGILVLAASLLLILKCPTGWHHWALAFLLPQFLLLTLLQLYQIRWGLLAAPVLATIAAVSIDGLWQKVANFKWQPPARAALAVICAGAALVEPWANWRHEISRGMDSDRVANPAFSELQPLMLREIGLVIRFDAQVQTPVLLSTPEYSLLLAYFGGFQTIGTLYWENLAGMKAAGAMLSERSESEARALLQSRGVTHIVLLPNDPFLQAYDAGIHPDAGEREFHDSFGYQLLESTDLPDWLEPIPYPSALARQLNVQPRIFRVVDNKHL